MAIAFVKSTGKIRATSNPDSASGSFGSLPTSGNFVAVQAAAYDNASNLDLGTGACTDNQSNTYSRAVRSTVYNTTGGDYVVVATYNDDVIGSPSGTFTITVNPAGTGSFGAIVFVGTEWSGMSSSSLDVTATSTGNTNSPVSGTTATTAQADELILANYTGVEYGGDGIFTSITVESVSPAWTERAEELDGDTYQGCEFDSRIVTATGTQSCSWTTVNTGTAPYAACIATFKAATAAAAGVPFLPMTIGQAIQSGVR